MESDHEWRRSYSFPQSKSEVQKSDFGSDLASGPPTLEETITIVKEKVWSFRDAWKGLAEVLVGFGLSPSVVGYSTVPLTEDGYICEKDEGEAALQRATKEEEVLKSRSYSGPSLGSVHQRHVGEESSFINHVAEYEEDDHFFSESVRQDQDERRSLTSSGSWQTIDALDDEDDNKKDA